ncbi:MULTISPECIES: DotG/IcmE/VirB10 family protein [Gluconobacter]|uniref:DotG/IcmE/VirB10 family protein n=1 Tax=Gluconobacter TaxID=441 RepID=UPI002010CB7F|nr:MULTISPECIES: DotG/IcmE/VirB10 family protein [Gluconobacter]MCP1236730.1 DotG/IcmE/VirB10 family protein [Gluconobacter kondonii]
MSEAHPGPAASASGLATSLKASRRPAFAAAGLLVVAAGGWYMMSHGSAPKPKSAALQTPNLAPPAGGNNHSDKLDSATVMKEKADADAAKANGRSFASALTTDRPLGDDKAPLLGRMPGSGSATNAGVTPPGTPRTPPPPAVNQFTRVPEGTKAASEPPASRERRPGELSEAQEVELLAAWSGRPASLDMELPAETTAAGGGRQDRASFTQEPQAAQSGASAAQQNVATVKPATHRLLAAGRGVYGHSLLGINSDYPGTPVLVEIDSGPLAHDRLSGSFERKDERLVIKFDKLMIGDSDPLPVSAYAVAPDTMETGLASEVHEHLPTRIFLPAAAAFVEGLGNAMQNSNTNSVTSGLGVSSFTHLTLPQQLGVAAGRAGQEMGQILQKQTPQNPTVLLHKDDPIGVIFTDPVDVP